MEKLTYSKCPHCRQHGIKVFSKIGHRTNRIIVCKYCKKQFQVNWALSFLGKILIPTFFGLCGLLLKSVGLPLWFWGVLAIFAFGLFEYFAPMEAVDSLEPAD